MTKKVIRLNESDLHNMVKESVKRILKEGYFKDKPITYDLGNSREDKYQTLRYNGIAVGTVDHTHKTVSPMHGYFYPNPVSKGLMRYAKKLGYEYAFDDNWEKAKNSKKKTLKEDITYNQRRNMLGVYDDDELNAACIAEKQEDLELEIWHTLSRLVGNNLRKTPIKFDELANILSEKFNFDYIGADDTHESYIFSNGQDELSIYPNWFYSKPYTITIHNINIM